MQWASALLEYLVSGFIALLWLVPLIRVMPGASNAMSQVNEQSLALFLPVAYVLGILLDATSSYLLERFRTRDESHASYGRSAYILAHGSDALIKTMEAYVGRDRIARGVVLSAAISIVVYACCFDGPLRIYAMSSAAIALAWSFAVWHRLDKLSSKFKDQAATQLRARSAPARGEHA